ncbi:MAG: sterol carrier protein [Promethearchaeia archaeon]|nr:MAG: sterol carrier protein [Candidatus Lokiarchaeia archaeon]
MGLKFGTEEWIKAYLEKLNANKAYEESAKTWEGDFVFVIEPEGNLDHELRFYVDLWHGKARSGKLLKPGEEVDSEFVFSGKWGNWEKLIDGKLDPIKGLMARKFKLKGDMKKVMRAVKAAKNLVKTIIMVDTEKY